MVEFMIVAAPLRDLLPPQHTRARIVLIVALISLCFAVLAALPRPAAAGGVHFDPESPAGKEYALPLDQARHEGAGKTGIDESGSVEPAPLFGQGVGGPGSGTRATPVPGNPADGSGNGARNQAGDGAAQTGPDAAARRVALSTDHGYEASSGALLVVLVLLAGVGLGLLLRGVGRVRAT